MEVTNRLKLNQQEKKLSTCDVIFIAPNKVVSQMLDLLSVFLLLLLEGSKIASMCAVLLARIIVYH